MPLARSRCGGTPLTLAYKKLRQSGCRHCAPNLNGGSQVSGVQQ
jgi:hypothetical protein